jgi:hypothetical protein
MSPVRSPGRPAATTEQGPAKAARAALNSPLPSASSGASVIRRARVPRPWCRGCLRPRAGQDLVAEVGELLDVVDEGQRAAKPVRGA